MLLWLIGTALAADLPTVEVDWKGDVGTLKVEAPAGEHVTDTAPADVALAWAGHRLDAEVLGSNVSRGVPLWDIRGTTMEGTLLAWFFQSDATRNLFVVAVIHAIAGTLFSAMLPVSMDIGPWE